MKNPLDAVKTFLGVVCVAGAFAAAAFAPGAGGQPAAPPPSPTPTPAAIPAPSPSPTPAPEVTLAFTGDVNFADDWYNMLHYAKTAGVEDCFDPLLLEEMRGADILLSNNEFAFSDRGAPMAGKQFTFCSRPENVELWQQLGVDIVGLANNHCFDYGADAFADTLTTLSDAGITYVGAGADLEEAMTPRYFTVDGLTIGYVACTRAEKSRYAAATTPRV